MHSDYLIKALKECGKRMYHRVVDTTCFASLETLLEVAKNCEMFLIDLKVMDSKRHKDYTGVSNEKILSNIVELSKTNREMIFRIPLIKGINSDLINIERTAQFINSLEGKRIKINLLPYHKVAENKLVKMGRAKDFIEFETPNNHEISEIILTFKKYGINASIGG